jgi:hypothetical protein
VTCSDFLKELTDYLDEAMDAQTRAELEDHLQWCHNCYVICNTTKRTIEIYRDSHLYELPEDLRVRLRTAVISKCHSHKADSSDGPTQQTTEPPGQDPAAQPRNPRPQK